MNHDTPISKDAALFLSRKKRVQTVQEALNRLAIEVCSAATVGEIRNIMREKLEGKGSSRLKITLTLQPDGAKTNRVFCVMDTRVDKHLGQETYSDLEL